MSEWNKVEDCLPEVGTMCVVGNGNDAFTIAQYGKNGWCLDYNMISAVEGLPEYCVYVSEDNIKIWKEM